MKRIAIKLVVLLLLGAACVGVWLGLEQLDASTGRFDPSSPRDVQRLREVANSAAPMLTAIAEYREMHGVLPAKVEALFNQFIPASGADARGWRGWTYWPGESGGYVLYYKLGWDPMLWYEEDGKGNGMWSYEPGDGSNATILEFCE